MITQFLQALGTAVINVCLSLRFADRILASLNGRKCSGSRRSQVGLLSRATASPRSILTPEERSKVYEDLPS
jgi:hypothetical protein